ncbi:hypothetical protein [Lactococcus fujiensis]|uniref:hypothetical protein n=1 Tax=Lactococcus fujiensis TaxID=610251 RepID=UPI000BDEDF93|nr:hypothetical protein [Lactococcus fujiensis]
MSWTEYYIQAAKKSKWNFELWLRYLNKAIQRDGILLTSQEIDCLLQSEDLTSFQKIFLELAVQEGTTPWEMTVEMSEPAQFNHLNAILQEF